MKIRSMHRMYETEPVDFRHFVQFIHVYPKSNLHWQPFDDRCGTGGLVKYDMIAKLEDGVEAALERLMSYSKNKVDISQYHQAAGNSNSANKKLEDYYHADDPALCQYLKRLVTEAYAHDIIAFGYTLDIC